MHIDSHAQQVSLLITPSLCASYTHILPIFDLYHIISNQDSRYSVGGVDCGINLQHAACHFFSPTAETSFENTKMSHQHQCIGYCLFP